MSFFDKYVDISDMIGKKIKSVIGLKEGSDKVVLITECGSYYTFIHEQDYCESVYLCDFEGDPESLVGATIVSAEESSNSDDENRPNDYSESWTWTFYRIETTKGEIWMRWLGESNGYYSESVDIVKTASN